MVEIGQWMEGYVSAVERVFGDRAIFIGLQGSYGRGEPTESSDIDVVLILDRLNPAARRVGAGRRGNAASPRVGGCTHRF